MFQYDFYPNRHMNALATHFDLQGAAMVLVSGCHFADCHYINAVTWTQRRLERIWNKMERLGIRPERVQLEWISAAEGPKFQKTMNQMEELRQAVTQEEIDQYREQGYFVRRSVFSESIFSVDSSTDRLFDLRSPSTFFP